MDVRQSIDYEVFVRRAHKCGRLEIEQANAELYRKLETLEMMSMLGMKTEEDYSSQLATIKSYVAEALYKGIERIDQPINNHSIPALMECISKLKRARNSKDVTRIIKLGLSVFAEEGVLI